MIYLIHGEDQSASRQKLRSIISGLNHETVYLDGKKISMVDVVSTCESNSLFSESKTIVIENLFAGRKSKERSIVEDYLIKRDQPHDIIIWEGKKLDKSKNIKSSKNFQVFQFDFNANIFKFVDSLGQSPFKESYTNFHSLLKSNDVELIFTMIVRQLRFLLLVKAESNNITGLPDWQFYKFVRQAKLFTLEKLILFYRQLLLLDYQIKSGRTPMKKDQLLDIFLTGF